MKLVLKLILCRCRDIANLLMECFNLSRPIQIQLCGVEYNDNSGLRHTHGTDFVNHIQGGSTPFKHGCTLRSGEKLGKTKIMHIFMKRERLKGERKIKLLKQVFAYL